MIIEEWYFLTVQATWQGSDRFGQQKREEQQQLSPINLKKRMMVTCKLSVSRMN